MSIQYEEEEEEEKKEKKKKKKREEEGGGGGEEEEEELVTWAIFFFSKLSVHFLDLARCFILGPELHFHGFQFEFILTF